MNIIPKGEYIILIDKINEEQYNEIINKEITLEEEYDKYEKQGYSKKDIIKNIAKNRGVNKNEIYQYFLKK